MIYTFDTKKAQLEHGCFTVGSGPVNVLILGSCRAMPYLNYFAPWNGMSGDGMTIRYINPFDWHWNRLEQEVNLEEVINGLETDEKMIGILKATDIFVHEHFGNYGMFNTDRASEKNIYQFGMAPRIDISIPNFNDHFILHDDFLNVGQQPPDNYPELGEAAVRKFCNLCELTSFPEMGEHFRENWRKKRFFWAPNHISAEFSLYIFRLMNEKFLQFPLTDQFWNHVGGDDMYRDPHTAVHPKDIAAYGLTWNP